MGVVADGGDGGGGGGGGDLGGHARERAMALLEATHDFPCEYEITVIAFNREPVTAALRRELGLGERDAEAARPGASAEARPGEPGHRHRIRPSREGKYLSHRFSTRVDHAAQVIELHARLRAVDGVVTIL